MVTGEAVMNKRIAVLHGLHNYRAEAETKTELSPEQKTAKDIVSHLFGTEVSQFASASIEKCKGYIYLRDAGLEYTLLSREYNGGFFESEINNWEQHFRKAGNLVREAIDYKKGIAGFVYTSGVQNG